MKISNLDAGIHHAIKAQFIAKGASVKNAGDTATKHLPDARKLFHKACKETPCGRKMDDVAAMTHAMRAVVTWARKL